MFYTGLRAPYDAPLDVMFIDSFLMFNTNGKLDSKSSHSTHAKDLMFDDSVIDYDTTNDVFKPMFSYHKTQLITDSLSCK